MSGIGAAWGASDPATAEELLRRMLPALSRPSQGLSAPALRFVDGAACAAQPADLYADERILLACDADLVQLEATDAADSAASLLARRYRELGGRMFDALEGAFAIVLYDRVERRLVAAVDGFGIKRLAWWRRGDTVIVSSRVDAIRAARPDLRVNPRAIANVLNYSANLAPETIFLEVSRLPPGSVLTVTAAGAEQRTSWDVCSHDGRASEASLAEELRAVVARSVRRDPTEYQRGGRRVSAAGPTAARWWR
jgi:asparagine synthetase B (glutamine-hydrolysing)